MESYARGETEPALLEETIGANLDRTVARFPDREAMVEFATGTRWTWRELDRDVEVVARGLLAAGLEKGDRIGIWGPNSARWTITQYAAAKIGAILVNVNPAYRTHEFSYAVNQSGMRVLISATAFKTSDYRGMIEETAPLNAGLERVIYLDTDDWDALVAEGEALDADVLNVRMRTLDAGDPINIQYTSGTTGRPKGATLSHRNILNNGFMVTELIGLHRAGPVVHPGALLPLLRDGDGQPGLHQSRLDDGDPRPRVRPGGHVASDRGGAVHGGVRRTDDVHRHAAPPDVRRPRPVEPAHGLHGRVDLPGRGDEALHQRHAHGGRVHRLRHDRDVPGLDPDRGSTTTSSVVRRPSAGSTRTSRSRSSTRSPERPSSEGSPGSSAPAATR